MFLWMVLSDMGPQNEIGIRRLLGPIEKARLGARTPAAHQAFGFDGQLVHRLFFRLRPWAISGDPEFEGGLDFAKAGDDGTWHLLQ